jgi:hypothetical protein
LSRFNAVLIVARYLAVRRRFEADDPVLERQPHCYGDAAMLFTDSSCHTERLTQATMQRLLSSDHVDRYQDCGWHCATGYKDGRVHVMVHADSKVELDIALAARPDVRPPRLVLRRTGRRTPGAVH